MVAQARAWTRDLLIFSPTLLYHGQPLNSCAGCVLFGHRCRHGWSHTMEAGFDGPPFSIPQLSLISIINDNEEEQRPGATELYSQE